MCMSANGKMKEFLIFLSNFIKYPKEVGAMAPSSRFLRDKMMNHIDFRNAKNIVELGPGIGIFTKNILQRSGSGTTLFCFEVNKEFCAYLSSNIPDEKLVVINESAENLRNSLKKFELQKADCIVSSLPFLDFSAAKRRKIINEVKQSLKDKGKFVLFQYTTRIENMLEANFSNVEKNFVLLNVPPAFLYVCEK